MCGQDESKFSWFPKITKTLEKVPDEQRYELMWALARYGTYGEEPDLRWPLDAVFESLRDDIDNSKKAIRHGGTGGRGNKKAPSEDAERVVSVSEKAPFEEPERGVSDDGKGGFDDAKPIPFHTIPSHTKGEGRFAPPSRDEVAAYAEEIGLPEPEVDRFMDHFASNGWRVSGRTRMRDWRASLRNWKRRAPEFQRDPPAQKPMSADERERRDREQLERYRALKAEGRAVG